MACLPEADGTVELDRLDIGGDWPHGLPASPDVWPGFDNVDDVSHPIFSLDKINQDSCQRSRRSQPIESLLFPGSSVRNPSAFCYF
jgi:hypothetical protein